MKISGKLSSQGQTNVIVEFDIPIEKLLLSRRDQLALKAPEPKQEDKSHHSLVEHNKANRDDHYIMQQFDTMAWKYQWADKMIAASGE